MKIKLVGLIALLSLSFSAFAVGGYQNAKFGISKQELKKIYHCNWQNDEENLFCDDFKFGNLTTSAYFFFLDNKFERAAFEIPDDYVEGLIDGLKKKYRLSSPLPEEVNNPQPNQYYDLGFDDNTVIVRFSYENDMTESIFLMYSSDAYDNKSLQKQSDSFGDAL